MPKVDILTPITLFLRQAVMSAGQKATIRDLIGAIGSATRTITAPDADGVLALGTTVRQIALVTAGALTVDRYVDLFIYGTAGATIGSYTVNFPSAANSRDGQCVTVLATQNITTVTVTPGTGNTLGGLILSTITANSSYGFLYVAASAKWVRIA
jgi:hypothetical protein